jgi:hypothetical protein
VTSLLLAVATAACATNQPAVVAIGEHRAPSGDCTARLSVSPNGGFRQLFLAPPGSSGIHIADDVTGLAWISNSELVYAASPIYGAPGIFLVHCTSGVLKPVTVVAPRAYNAAYPKGADFFELKSAEGRRVTYYYGPDVDAIDFKSLRSAANERSVEVR